MTEQKVPPTGRMSVAVGRFEYVVVLALMLLLMVVVIIGTVELAVILYRDVISPGPLLDVEEMLELFGFFLLVLMGLELITTLKTFIYDRVVHMEVVLEVSLIAVTQKIIILDTARADGFKLLGLATLILTLAVALWLVRIARARRT